MSLTQRGPPCSATTSRPDTSPTSSRGAASVLPRRGRGPGRLRAQMWPSSCSALAARRRGAGLSTVVLAATAAPESFDVVPQNGNGAKKLSRPPLPLLTGEQIVQRMRTSVPEDAHSKYLAYFSSELGGITQEPAFMQVPIDDHMVHRGHAAFDTCILADGFLYQLDAHIERLMISAEKAGIKPFWTPSVIANIVHDTAAASGVKNGFLRFWMSAGKGGFGLGSSECIRPAFYCIATKPPVQRLYGPEDEEMGIPTWRAKTTPVGIKSPCMATIKTNNYLPNALSADDAEADLHATHGIFVDEEGFVSEGGTFNVGFITKDNELVVPEFDNCLAGVTIQRIMELVPQSDSLSDLTVCQRKITAVEAKGCKEMFAASSTSLAIPITTWDRTTFFGGEMGYYTQRIRRMLYEDMRPNPPHALHTEVNYGIVTHMQ
ncbi:uncharacterized protein LOC142357725 [Convolutriloba macropyga]|uniref:uncharacterized protein LOC142357725 n=1 Tax=Convolutriloba macropyga TaxID=536237 RepID=UPI003F526225